VRSLSRTRRGRTVWRRTGATVGRAAATVRGDPATVTTRLGVARRSFGFVGAHASTEIEQHVQQHLFLVRQIPAAMVGEVGVAVVAVSGGYDVEAAACHPTTDSLFRRSVGRVEGVLLDGTISVSVPVGPVNEFLGALT